MMIYRNFRRTAARACATLTVLLSTSFLAGTTSAVTIDFNTLAHGEVANGSLGSVTISAVNPNRGFDYAVGFDSEAVGTSDIDLQAGNGLIPWSGGNIADQDLGTMLILQENRDGCSTGTCDDPDDEGARPAGTLIFDFSVSILDFGFDAVDIESLSAENATIRFFDGVDSASVDLMEFFDAGSALYDSTLSLGDNTANRFEPISAAYLGLSKIDRVEFDLGGSGALDNLEVSFVPEPSTVLLMGLGLAVLGASRRVSRTPGV